MPANLQCAEAAYISDTEIEMTFSGTSNDFMVTIDRVGNSFRLDRYFRWHTYSKKWVELPVSQRQYRKFNLAVIRTLKEVL